MKMQQYDTVKLKDGRKGVIVEIFGDGEELLVDIGSSPADWKTISVSENEVADVIFSQASV